MLVITKVKAFMGTDLCSWDLLHFRKCHNDDFCPPGMKYFLKRPEKLSLRNPDFDLKESWVGSDHDELSHKRTPPQDNDRSCNSHRSSFNLPDAP
jgi:hypothetical protein